MNTSKFFTCAMLIMLCTFLPAGTSHSDTLSLVIDDTGAGLSLASAGVGLQSLGNGTETITVNIGGPVTSAYLYWAGREDDNVSVLPVPKDQELLFAGLAVTGDVIGSEITPKYHNLGYRADVTTIVSDNYTGPGTYSFSVQDNDLSENLHSLNGASLLIMYTDESNAAAYRVIVYDGLDFAYAGDTSPPAKITEPVIFTYEPMDAHTTAELLIVAGDLDADRKDRIDISNNASIENELNGSSGENWDNDLFTIDIPSGVDSTTVEVISPSEQGVNPDSLLWVLTALRLPVSAESLCGNNTLDSGEMCDGDNDQICPGECFDDCSCPEEGNEGCTPAFWQNHTDSWPAPYSPGDSFFSIFGRTVEMERMTYGVQKLNRRNQAASRVPPDITLLEALQANGECVNSLAVQAAAALLNASSNIYFKYSVAQIILMVQSAIPAGEPVDCETVDEITAMLMSQNELWCPLTPPLPPPPPAVFEVTLSPATATLKPGEKIEYTAFTTRNGYEVRSAYIWEIIPGSTIGSSIDKDTEVYTAGDTCSEITEIIKITDLRHFHFTATASITVEPTLCEVEVSPLSSTVNSAETLEFTAVTTCDGIEVEDSNYQWDIASTIGSTLNGADYTAGDNNSDADVTDIITVTDTAHCNATGAADVTVSFPPPPPADFDIKIDPDNKIVASNGEIRFSAVTATSPSPPLTVTQPSPPNYEWSVESVIGSHIDAVTGIYTSGENTVGHQVMDAISVTDHANNDTVETIEVLVTYGKITSIADFKYWPLPFNTPPTILVSRWIPGYFIGVLVGQNLNTNASTVLHFDPNDDILPFGSWQVVFGDIIIFGIWITPNPVTNEINITVDTEGELAVSNNLRLTIGLLPWNLDLPH